MLLRAHLCRYKAAAYILTGIGKSLVSGDPDPGAVVSYALLD
jgi:hypothetical protein